MATEDFRVEDGPAPSRRFPFSMAPSSRRMFIPVTLSTLPTEGISIASSSVAMVSTSPKKSSSSLSKLALSRPKLTAAERAAQALVPRGMALRDYLNIPADATVDAKLETQRQIINALRQAEAIRTRPALAPLSALSIPSTISATLAKTIESVAADAEARLTIHIRRHGMQEQGERWIGEGIPYVVEDECPFCGRDGLGDLDLIKSYQAHFSEAYESLSREVARLRADVDRHLR